MNDSPDNIRASADFILEKLHNRIERLQLLEFMRLGEEKYQSLGMPYPMKDLDVDKDAFTEKVKKMAEYFNSRGNPLHGGYRNESEEITHDRADQEETLRDRAF